MLCCAVLCWPVRLPACPLLQSASLQASFGWPDAILAPTRPAACNPAAGGGTILYAAPEQLANSTPGLAAGEQQLRMDVSSQLHKDLKEARLHHPAEGEGKASGAPVPAQLHCMPHLHNNAPLNLQTCFRWRGSSTRLPPASGCCAAGRAAR